MLFRSGVGWASRCHAPDLGASKLLRNDAGASLATCPRVRFLRQGRLAPVDHAASLAHDPSRGLRHLRHLATGVERGHDQQDVLAIVGHGDDIGVVSRHRCASVDSWNRIREQPSARRADCPIASVPLVRVFDLVTDEVTVVADRKLCAVAVSDRKSTRLNSSHSQQSRMPSSA